MKYAQKINVLAMVGFIGGSTLGSLSFLVNLVTPVYFSIPYMVLVAIGYFLVFNKLARMEVTDYRNFKVRG